MAKRVTRVKSDVQEIALQTADNVALAIKRIGNLEREQVRLSTLQADEKATKATATVAECGNAYGGSQNFMFKDGTTLSAGTELNDNGKVVNKWLTINDKNVVRVKNPKGVPSAYACFALPNSKNAYCVK